MIAFCCRCGYTDYVDLRVGSVHSERTQRKYTNRNLPDVFICVACMRELE